MALLTVTKKNNQKTLSVNSINLQKHIKSYKAYEA